MSYEPSNTNIWFLASVTCFNASVIVAYGALWEPLPPGSLPAVETKIESPNSCTTTTGIVVELIAYVVPSPTLTVMIAVPSPTAVTIPFSSTVATVLLLDS